MSSPQVDFLSTPEGLGQNQKVSEPVTIKPKRQMQEFTADAVITEEHEDELEITDHPVEQGAVITDHAYKRPSWVRLVYGWSAGSPQAEGDLQFLQNLYTSLLNLQQDRTPFDVYTGKRKYSNMLLKVLRTETNKETENSLIIYAMCREVLIANTQTVILASVATDPANMEQPQNTSPVSNQGTQQLQPAPNFNIADYPSLGGFPKITP